MRVVHVTKLVGEPCISSAFCTYVQIFIVRRRAATDKAAIAAAQQQAAALSVQRVEEGRRRSAQRVELEEGAIRASVALVLEVGIVGGFPLLGKRAFYLESTQIYLSRADNMHVGNLQVAEG